MGHPPDVPIQTEVSPRWVWSQHWHDLLFLHWQVPVAELRPRVPAQLEIATYNGDAWVSLVLFRLRVRPRWLPFLPGLSNLLEVNLRTYVTFRGRPGIWFLSVHGDNRWAIRLAKWLTPMPYRHARMSYQRVGDRFTVRARRPSPAAAALTATFEPIGDEEESEPGSLDAWLLERYRLYIQDSRQRLLQAEVAHPRWMTQGVAVSVSANTLGVEAGLDLWGPPDLAHYSPGLHARFGAFRSVVEVGPARDEKSACLLSGSRYTHKCSLDQTLAVPRASTGISIR